MKMKDLFTFQHVLSSMVIRVSLICQPLRRATPSFFVYPQTEHGYGNTTGWHEERNLHHLWKVSSCTFHSNSTKLEGKENSQEPKFIWSLWLAVPSMEVLSWRTTYLLNMTNTKQNTLRVTVDPNAHLERKLTILTAFVITCLKSATLAKQFLNHARLRKPLDLQYFPPGT